MSKVEISERLARRAALVLRESGHGGLAEQIEVDIRDALGDPWDDLGSGKWAGLSCGHAVRLYDNHPKPKIGDVRFCGRNRDCETNPEPITVVAMIREDYAPMRRTVHHGVSGVSW